MCSGGCGRILLGALRRHLREKFSLGGYLGCVYLGLFLLLCSLVSLSVGPEGVSIVFLSLCGIF